MEEELSLLLKLQKIDSEIGGIAEREEEIPRDMQSLESEVAERERQVGEEEKSVAEMGKKRRMLEGDLEASNETIGRYQRQLRDVKSNKEYAALRHEIEREKSRVWKLEEEILMLMEEIDEASKKVASSKLCLEKERTLFEKKKAALERELDALKGEYAIKEDERKRITVQLRRDILERYERIRERWGGLAVVTIDGEICRGCFTSLPPQFVNELRRGDRLLTCENCGRILIWEVR